MNLVRRFFQWIARLSGWLSGRQEQAGTAAQPPSNQPAPVKPDPPQPAPEPAVPAPAAERRWTLMIYMAGDNGLRFETEDGWTQIMAQMTGAGYTDIAELRRAGSTDFVQALVQFDTVTESDRSYRIVINGKGTAPTVHTIAETNTGDPDTLRDFIIWGQQTFPARHYAVVIWNHGGGWKEDDIYAGVRRVVRRRPQRRPVLFKRTYRALGKRLEESDDTETQQRWIAADDTSMDFLDNEELARALREAAARSGQPIHLIGMDACLMAMVEVAYQVQEQGEVLVASEEVEPMPGWPYTQILEALAAQPEQPPRDLARSIVELYGQSYAGGADAITQSAIALDRLESLIAALRAFVDAVETNWADDAIYRALTQAHLYTFTFEDSDYRDLHDFMRQVRQRLSALQERDGISEGVNQVLSATEAICTLLESPERSPILATLAQGEAFLGDGEGQQRIHGLAIYLPRSGHTISPAYAELAFHESRWHDLIALLCGGHS